MGIVSNIVGAPVRAVLGALGGMSDGLRGKVDENEQYADGASGQDPLKKSRAGRFLSNYAGIRGGEEMGDKYGTLGMALGGGIMAAQFVFGTAMLGAGLAGFPLFAGMFIIGATAFAGVCLGAYVSKPAGRVIGGILGAVGGAVVGAYSAVFKRGYYKEPEVAREGEPPSPDKPIENAKQNISFDAPARQQYAPPPTPGYEGVGFAGREQSRRQQAAPAQNSRS